MLPEKEETDWISSLISFLGKGWVGVEAQVINSENLISLLASRCT